MARTIGKRWPRRGNPPWLCGVCGAKWPADKLVRSLDGVLQCPDDRERSRYELSSINSESAREYARRFHPVRSP